ncbi:MFS transporter [Paraburkholderia caballeronis]|uniref:Drug resistance transporter, EmrB/QacA subfamily n=1 Tax=Paraburkholderia caballeronis TaxID=416943 RepID=A0A1H7NVD5_9BURK|nr:MFS transporter [Paraburkholderia caballeronis]PXW25512.1 EmrB/QacA subfamily drug resistance transporter [Paraburkholderia caballeronis]PXX01119.1 EmrB/QacA subfamily drug resistance transporter [Paraburkholderia caballeronis]RAJ99528.1 EmrB/QacA subfamily drug resistance transporter [Paraburkholderia caballeronis]TDV11494.1 EmrB/QacA subfamily drug resistance transporter [Paraburkholderia caballeronis]TDV14684.1 EmrB/QacA subfamily drug resistance transporter [Paraburkholderia caballeroni
MPLALGTFIVPLIVACAMFMENVDATVIVTSLPALARDLGHDPITLKLAVTSYVIGLGVFIPICGWVADRFGSRTVFRTAIGIFIAGSLLCAASTSLTMFVAARFVQGIGGAMMVPVGRIIIFRSLPKSDFIRAVNYLTVPALLGPVVGPPLGGFITTFLHWRLIFFVNIPIGVLGIWLAGRHIANMHEEHPGRLDLVGFLLSAGGAALFMLGLSLVGSGLVPVGSALAMCVGGVVLLAIYWFHARRVERPVLDLSLLRIPSFNASVAGGSLFRIGLGAVPFLLPLTLQEGLGMTAFASGSITCASAFGSIFMKTIASRALRRYGFRHVLIVNAMLAGASIAACGFFFPDTPRWAILLIVLIGGLFPSLQFTALNSLAYADIPTRDIGRATSVASVIQQLSLGLGVTIAGIVLQISHTLQGHPTIVWSDFWPAFVVVGLFCVASVPVTMRLPAGTGDEIARGTRRAA